MCALPLMLLLLMLLLLKLTLLVMRLEIRRCWVEAVIVVKHMRSPATCSRPGQVHCVGVAIVTIIITTIVVIITSRVACMAGRAGGG